MTRFVAVLLILGLSLGCQKPLVTRVQVEHQSVVVDLCLPDGLPDEEETMKAYRKGLEEAMALSLKLVPKEQASPETPVFRVMVAGRFTRSRLLERSLKRGGEAALHTGPVELMFDLPFANRPYDLQGLPKRSLQNGLFFASTDYLMGSMNHAIKKARLGYEPSYIYSQVMFYPEGHGAGELIARIPPEDVFPQMRPGKPEDMADPVKRVQEEGRALGMTVWQTLMQKYQWNG